jgi:hypothetical protein
MERQAVKQILENFIQVTGIKAKWRAIKKTDYKYDHVDGIVEFNTGGTKIEMATEAKNNIQNPNLPGLLNQKNNNGEVLVLANTIIPRFKKELQTMGINYIDGAGNAFIKHDPLFIWIEGRKELETHQDLKSKPFSKAGLKVIFQFLQHDDYINETFREIAKATEVSLDTVHKTVNGLKELQYLVPLNNHTLQWNRKKELFDRWITEYETRLKPALHIGNFAFINEDKFLDWKKINFQNTLTKWGGEPAGELLTGYLKPEKLTIYTKEGKLDWIRNYKLVPNAKGYINIYERFWNGDELDQNTTPPLLVYADLINTGNSRNIETAQKIYEQYLQDKF